MIALSQEKYLEYVQRMNKICNPSPAAHDALRLIKTICEENSIPVSDGHTTAMSFVWQIATAALGPVALPKPGALR